MSKDGWLVFDDFKHRAFNNNRDFRWSRKLASLMSALHNNLKYAVADVDFCRTEAREEAKIALCSEIPDLKVRWLFFANDRPVCEANVRERNSDSLRRELSLIADYSPLYDIPQGAVVLPIWRSENWQRATGN
ncbi:MAG TPA: hypothetical protein VGG04_14260 [Candidatus Sulfotelmatobacter sp.]|jgi:hypothetical protein